MKQVTTVFCAICFLISGIIMAVSGNESSHTGYKTAAASVYVPQMSFPKLITDTATLDLPEDILRDLAKRKGILDTVYFTKTDTLKVTKVKWRQAPAPAPVMEINVTCDGHRTDTVQVPVYYLATQVGTKEGPTGDCISIYEVHKVDEICTEINDSSMIRAPQHECDVGD